MFENIHSNFPQEANNIIAEWIISPNEKGDTCLHYASYKGNFSIISLLCKYNIKVNQTNKQGNNVLHNPEPFDLLKRFFDISDERHEPAWYSGALYIKRERLLRRDCRLVPSLSDCRY